MWRRFKAFLTFLECFRSPIDFDWTPTDKEILKEAVARHEIFKKLLGVLREDEKMALVSPKILFAPGFEFHKNRYKKSEVGRIIWWAGAKMDWANVRLVHRGLDQVDDGQFDKLEETGFVSGCCFLIKKEKLPAPSLGYAAV